MKAQRRFRKSLANHIDKPLVAVAKALLADAQSGILSGAVAVLISPQGEMFSLVVGDIPEGGLDEVASYLIKSIEEAKNKQDPGHVRPEELQ